MKYNACMFADTLAMKSGQDTDIIGSTVSGKKVNVDVGRNLDIQSLQTKKEYNEESTFVGGGFSVGGGKTSYSASASKGNMDSNYESVTEQAGIYAGKEGFEVKERKELATEFAKLGAEKIGDIAKENHWSEDDPRRALLHGLLGGITAELGGNNVLSGAVAAGGMESLQPRYEHIELSKPLQAPGYLAADEKR